MKNVKEIDKQHSIAMENIVTGYNFKKAHPERALVFFEKALEAETIAVELISSQLDQEPTRSMLCISAAYIALDCDKPKKAKEFVDIALSGNPSTNSISELKELNSIIKAKLCR